MVDASRTLKQALKRFGTYASSEDLQLEKMVDRMKGYPYSRNFKDDMKMINLFEAELVTILQLNNAFHMSHSTVKVLISKISSVPHKLSMLKHSMNSRIRMLTNMEYKTMWRHSSIFLDAPG